MPDLHIRLSSPFLNFYQASVTGAITFLLRYTADPSVKQLYLKDLGDGRLCSNLGKNSKLPHSDRNDPKQAAAPPLCRIKTLAIPAVSYSTYLHNQPTNCSVPASYRFLEIQTSVVHPFSVGKISLMLINIQ